MLNVLTIAKREVKRFRSRFSGGSRSIVLIVLALSLIVSFLVAQSGFTLSRGIYTIGVAPGGPSIDDARFNALVMDYGTGMARLADYSIDAFLYGDQAFGRRDDRSQYALGALKQYLDRQELDRIANDYDLDRAFPLRIETHYIAANASAAVPGQSISSLIGPTPIEWPEPSSTPIGPAPTSSAGPTPAPTAISPTKSATDDAVRQQLSDAKNGTSTKFKAQFVSQGEVIVPSLMNPPVPLSQVIIAFLYVVPIFFISVFFTSSFMDEKTNRKLNILLSAPVSPFDVIVGKLLPYLVFALAVIVAVTLFLGGDLLLAIAIFTPVVLFIFAIYLMVALFYRTYKDQTFFSMAAITVVTGYLVFPALFAGVNSLSYISPLTLAVQMYRGEPFTLLQYAFSTGPMYLVFALALFVGVRIFNEEYLMSFGPLYQKTGDAIYLAINRKHPYLSIFVLSLLLIPIVFMIELIFLALLANIPQMLLMIVALLVCSALVEEIAKSCGIAALLEYGDVKSYRQVLLLSAVAAFGFWAGEKLLLLLSLSIMPSSQLLELMNGNAGSTSPLLALGLLLLPLAGHFVFTSIVTLTTKRLGTRYYFFAVMCGTLVHVLYNLYNLHSMGAI